jgi:integrase
MTTEEHHLGHLRLRGHTPTSIYARKRALARLTAALAVPLLSATAADLADWRASLTVGDQAVVAYVSHVRSFYGWAVKEGLIAENPADALPVPRLARRVPRPVSEQDLMEALAAAPRRIRCWLVLAAWCGLRTKEVALLRVENILVTASPPVLIVAADATKGRTERVVPLSAFVLAELAAARLPASGYAFRRMDGRPGPNEPWRVSQLANKHLHECGVQSTLHALRHRFGTETYRASRDLRAVQELLGHASPSTTAAYAAYDRPLARAAVDALPVPERLRIVASGDAG